jgi:hypothetical protein
LLRLVQPKILDYVVELMHGAAARALLDRSSNYYTLCSGDRNGEMSWAKYYILAISCPLLAPVVQYVPTVSPDDCCVLVWVTTAAFVCR